MEIKVLGSGCKNCKKLLENVNQSLEELNLKANVLYITDYIEIANTGLLRTPGLMINGKIVSSGKVLSVNEIKQLIASK
ncbi:MAG: thioredoxin family protein [Bacilli bacterium]|jgi:small redox-active disulfide protein 2|nr:thioredoxin family protein [Bacilli bacterium]MDD2681920.1 thioredoxin family protein [Bacilli bacterium]MDD3121636.1 thioredoxin family protein [Bacilli bacterium]MDD4063713.1 thioredoxin family protein [Bacilli bacterium]MDD4482414.1 thioredoxin family protein [Bacilli bacterium]